MVYCVGQRCAFEVECPEAETVMVCGDGLPNCCPMQRRIGDVWFALLILPPGTHTVRYMARFGRRTVCVGQDRVTVTEAEREPTVIEQEDAI